MNYTKHWFKAALAVTILAMQLLAPVEAHSARLKDISSIEGVRTNQLIGYGLVVGLKNTGDKSHKSTFTIQTLLSMLERLGTTVDVSQLTDKRVGVSDVRMLRDVRVENVAAVMVTADLPPFIRQGGKIDVVVSSLGDSKSLQGGTLLLTPLKAANGEVFAVAQGPLSLGGGYGERACKACETRNHPTVGRISGGAVVEKEVGFDFSKIEKLTISLNAPDFTTTQRTVDVINGALGEDAAKALDSSAIEVSIPQQYAEKKVELVAKIEGLDITTDTQAKVALDERTGTVVIGENVRISKVAISHGNLVIRVEDLTKASQPKPLGGGQTVVVPKTLLTVEELGGKSERLSVMEPGVNISDLVKALNAMGVAPRDLIAIFQALKASGALKAQIEII
ncbi:MAG: flagellar basal body P-ring protein FlgI [Nitrospinae bacterium]|nr:flagellar basal body P-ring protein FlgI [Nitrospinota bacterium]MBF0633403.1 flagellar basal body P-ring protein FlgI [Nitrospinota bacterium]